MEETKLMFKRFHGVSSHVSTELACDSGQGLLAVGLSNGILKMYIEVYIDYVYGEVRSQLI